ncbi:hypothetical protein ON010_g16006 [Phytophthora cinnamomi]|nr:hypothetical protein ON010_g16006 [Phytophthora cinnamomi]
MTFLPYIVVILAVAAAVRSSATRDPGEQAAPRSKLDIAKFSSSSAATHHGGHAQKHSYERKVAAALYFLAFVSGYVETALTLGMGNSYVIDIVDEVVRVLHEAADDVICFPRDLRGTEISPVPNLRLRRDRLGAASSESGFGCSSCEDYVPGT